jgi:hypothetical protein
MKNNLELTYQILFEKRLIYTGFLQKKKKEKIFSWTERTSEI